MCIKISWCFKWGSHITLNYQHLLQYPASEKHNNAEIYYNHLFYVFIYKCIISQVYRHVCVCAHMHTCAQEFVCVLNDTFSDISADTTLLVCCSRDIYYQQSLSDALCGWSCLTTSCDLKKDLLIPVLTLFHVIIKSCQGSSLIVYMLHIVAGLI